MAFFLINANMWQSNIFKKLHVGLILWSNFKVFIVTLLHYRWFLIIFIVQSYVFSQTSKLCDVLFPVLYQSIPLIYI